ncbi:MAG: PKD domain-containing protein [Bacteroidota bacterium]|nr:PKD domain-containing protein [Bacteroidota bacterium]
MKNYFTLLFLLINGLGTSLVYGQKEILTSKTNNENTVSINESNFKNLENVLLIRVSGNGYEDETIIRFLPQATENFDNNYDAWKIISSNSQVPSIFTKLADSSKIAMNALPELDKDWFVPVYLKINVPGQYLIEVEEVGAFDTISHLYLDDYLSNDLKNLKNVQQFYINVSQLLDGNTPSFELYAGLQINPVINNVSCYNAQDGSILLNKPGSNGFSFLIKDSLNNAISSGTTSNDFVTISGLDANSYIISYILQNNFTTTVNCVINEPLELIADFSLNNLEVSTSEAVYFSNNSLNALTFTWDFGDGSVLSNDFEPVHEYLQAGDYVITLTANEGSCNTSYTSNIIVEEVITGLKEIVGNKTTFFYANGIVTIQPEFNLKQNTSVRVYNLAGQLIYLLNKNENDSSQLFINTSSWNSGMYLISVYNEENLFTGKINIP